MAAIIDLTPDEMASIIAERDALKVALHKATAAFLYANGAQDDSLPQWDTLPDEAYHVPESAPGACDGGMRSGRATYMAQAADIDNWLQYWKVA